MSSIIPEIPLDVVVVIFEHLGILGGRNALARCSQVCRLWHHDAQRTLASRSTIHAIDIKYEGVRRKEWSEWHGQLMQVPAKPVYITWLSVSHNVFLDHAWLVDALACLPRLRHLSISLPDPFSHRFSIEPHPTPFEVALDTLVISSPSTSLLSGTVLIVVQCFPRAKFLCIDGIPLELPKEDPRVGDNISMPSISLKGLYEWYNDGWYEFLSQPRTAQAIHHLHLDLRQFYCICDENMITLFRNLTNLETLELDLQINPNRWPTGTRIWDRCRIFEKTLEPVLSATIHTLSFRLPEEEKSLSHEFSYSSLIFMPLLNAMPCTLRHVEVRRGGRSQESKWFLGSTSATTRRFAIDGFTRCLRRFPELRTVDIIIDWKESEEKIAEYREFLDRSFPEFESRIGLRFSAPLPSPFKCW